MKEEWRRRRNPLMPMLYALNALGRTPLSVNSSGQLVFSPASLPSAWALALIAFQAAVVLHLLSLGLAQPGSWAGWHSSINTITNSLLLGTVFHAVIASWWATPSIADAVNRWNKFYDELVAVTKPPNRSRVLHNSRLGVFAILLYTSAVTLADSAVFSQPSILKTANKMVYFLSVFYVNLMFWLWAVFCLMVKNAGECLQEDLLKSLNSLPDVRTLSSRRRLWTELHSCTVALSQSLGRTMQLWLSQTLIVVLLDVYGLLMYTLYDPSLDRSVHMVRGLLDAVVALFLCFAFSDRAQDSMSGDLLTALFHRRWLLAPKPVRVELDLLLETLETDKPCFEIQGLVMFDKLAIISVFEILCTYLVVLTQFKVAAESL